MFGLVTFLVILLAIVVNAFQKDLWESFKVRDGRNINRTHLIHQYNQICPIVYGRGFAADREVPKPHQICRHDYCYDNLRCHCDGRCCSNSPVGYMVTSYFRSEVYPWPNSGLEYVMVNECPYDYSDEMKQRCTKTGLLPVTSIKSKITYKNKFCAQCHLEDMLVKWSLGLSCPNDTHMNSNSYGNCSIQRFLEDQYRNIPTECRRLGLKTIEKQTISTCNMTGWWRQYDADIEWACHRFNRPFRHFKNIFCYICNPAIRYKEPTPLISTCAYIGSSNGTPNTRSTSSKSPNGSNSFYEIMCNTMEVAPRLKPFRNAYCYLCNRPVKNTEYLNLGEINIQAILRREFVLKIKLKGFTNYTSKIDNFKMKMKLLLRKLFNQTDNLNEYEEHQIMKFKVESKKFSNLSEELLQNWIDVCTSDRVCSRPTSMENNTGSGSPCDTCSCDTDCLFLNYRECCFDKLFTLKPYSCISASDFPILRKGAIGKAASDLRSFKLIDQCYGNDIEDSDRKGCLDNDMSDFLKRIPVESSDESIIQFRNIFCLLCNTGVPNDEINVYAKVQCINDIELDLFPNLSDILEFVNYHKCKVSFTLDKKSHLMDHCDLDINHIHLTNSAFVCFGNPGFEGEGRDINRLCTDNDLVPHVMNEISQPHFRRDLRISTVVYCTKKNTSLISSGHLCFFKENFVGNEWDKGRQRPSLGYRTLFTLSRTELENFRLLENSRLCRNGTVDIKTGKCYQVFCNGNRVLKMGSCVNVFETVSNTSFVATMSLQPCTLYESDNGRVMNNRSVFNTVFPTSMPPNISLSSADVCSEISKMIRNTFSYKAKIQYVHCYFKVFNCKKDYDYCHVNISEKATNQTWLLFSNTVIRANITVYVEFSNNRSHIERKLSDIAQNETVHVSNVQLCPANKKIIPTMELCDERDYYIPLHIHYNSPQSLIYVKSTLFCPLIEIAVLNVTSNESAGTVSFIYSTREISLKTDNVDILKDVDTKSRLRICKIEMRRLIPSDSNGYQNDFDRNYFLFSTFCNCMSLLSLVLTLLTYVIFKDLRTVPGRNNMSLAVCLLLAQSSLQYSHIYNTFDDNIHCQILGICIHYFWLGTFCALNVCSFHMYRVFSYRFISRPDHMSVFFRYTAYVYGFPALVISAVVSFNIVTRGTIGYGEILCFLDDFYSVIICFLTPSCLIFVSNIFFYGITFYNIKSSPTLRRNVEERNTLSIYVRLCTITGVAWPLLFVDALIPLSVLSYVVTFINAMQGFFIFISFICNRRVYDLYKGYVSSQQQRGTSLSEIRTVSRSRSTQRQYSRPTLD